MKQHVQNSNYCNPIEILIDEATCLEFQEWSKMFRTQIIAILWHSKLMKRNVQNSNYWNPIEFLMNTIACSELKLLQSCGIIYEWRNMFRTQIIATLKCLINDAKCSELKFLQSCGALNEWSNMIRTQLIAILWNSWLMKQTVRKSQCCNPVEFVTNEATC